MSKFAEEQVKAQQAPVARWLEGLTEAQVMAIACQYGIEDWNTQETEKLRTELLLIPAIEKLVVNEKVQTK